MEVISKSRGRPEVLDDGELASAAEAMADGIPASGPKSHRQMQNRLYALSAMERLSLLGDSELEQALADRSALRWLVDEEGARWSILAELGRIKDLEKFDTAVTWVLEHRPKTNEAVGAAPAVQDWQEQAAAHRRTSRGNRPRGKRVRSQASRDHARPRIGGAALGD